MSIDSNRYEAYIRLAIVAFYELKLAQAVSHLDKAETLAPEFAKGQIQIWRSKCEAEQKLQKPQTEKSGQRVTYAWYQTDALVKIQFP